jgi:AraC-like DNA-binding protein
VPNPREKEKGKENQAVELWRPAGMPGVELLCARYTSRFFPRHAHHAFALGVVEAGALGFSYRGQKVVATAGEINLANQGEPHDGFPAMPGGWQYRMLYLDPSWLEQVASELAGRTRSVPRFPRGVIQDPDLAERLWRTHRALRPGTNGELHGQQCLLELLAELIQRHADDPVEAGPPVPGLLRRAREWMDDQTLARPSLNELSEMAGMSPLQFLRAFRQSYGLTPHAYLVQRRIARAQSLLLRGQTIAQVATLTGFSDQSHLSRHFRRILGISPGAYRQGVPPCE